ncbi:MAG: hypothetical protein V3S51_07940, partial [Dehalococcoidia bacterium]
LTIMPLPVRIPTEWYDLLPKVLPLISRSPEQSKFYMPEETVQSFLQMWKQRLMRRDGEYAWVHLGGLECYETIPNFAKGVEHRIKGRDAEMKERGGLKALIQHWRTSVAGMNDLDDKAVLEARIGIVRTIEPLMSTLALSGSWGAAFERSRENILKIRPVVQRWIAQHGKQWNLDEPFGGKLSQRR